MRIIIQGQQFDGSYTDIVPPALIAAVESTKAWNDPLLAPLMAALRQYPKFGQVMEILDKFKVPYDLQ